LTGRTEETHEKLPGESNLGLAERNEECTEKKFNGDFLIQLLWIPQCYLVYYALVMIIISSWFGT